MKNILVSIALLTTFYTAYTMEKDIIRTQEKYLHIKAADEKFLIERERMPHSFLLAHLLINNAGSAENPIQVPLNRERFETLCISPQAQRTCHTITART